MNTFKELYSWYSKISQKYNFTFSDNGWFGLYGITYKNDIPVTQKFYVNIETPINTNDLPYMNNLNLYRNLVQHADNNRCFNNCIALKKHDNTINSYFHIKFKNNYKFADVDTIDDIDLSIYRQGVSVENKIRRYYYITEQKDIQKILKKTDILQDANEVKYLEITVNPLKCIVIFPDNCSSLVHNIIENNCSKKIIKDIKRLQNIFGIEPCLFGKYVGENIKTVYWDLTVKNFYTDSNLYNYIIS